MSLGQQTEPGNRCNHEGVLKARASGGWTGSGSGKGEMNSVGLAMMEGAAIRLDSTGTMTEGGDEAVTEAGLDGPKVSG